MAFIRKQEPINIVVYYPKTPEGKRSLEEQVASAHAQMAAQYIGKRKTPNDRKRLMEAVLSRDR